MSSLLRLSRHTIKQLQFIAPGLAITYYFDIHDKFWGLLDDRAGWGRTLALSSLGFGAITIALFLYVLLMPWVKGLPPDYRSWRESGELSKAIPMLTASIVAGWSSLSFTLGRWSGLGLLEGIIGASGVYALAFGLLGLLPAPRIHRR
ncbi:hypothetical protein NEOLEDRAFT_1141147 [Neolentinus lepideus HHB14362 ss-1]|uniref:Uncharacterized protein n=1 Tax=Neolentinus lepideus HHB14362 ss-1 TaxID=1314782 RepID=A0A165NVJ9_9AGAM|nr:hypothetical protein NEOLEDRAFT_1141147 [Neolentinus lepideus HHB14362 ss-1]